MELLKKYWIILVAFFVLIFAFAKRKTIKKRVKRKVASYKLRKSAYNFMRNDIGMSRRKALKQSSRKRRGSRYNDGSKMF